jgi:hypothetical protein
VTGTHVLLAVLRIVCGTQYRVKRNERAEFLQLN